MKLSSGESLTTRHFLQDLAGTDFYKNYNDYVCKFCQDLGIKIDLAINNPNLKDNELGDVLNYVEDLNPDELTLTKNLKPFFEKNYKNCFHIYSFNNPRPTKEDFEDPFWNSYAIANAFFWDANERPKNKESRLILNTGCPAGGPPCVDILHNNGCKEFCITRCNDTAKFLAYHVWFGEDLRLFEKYYGDTSFVYKLTTRNRLCTLESLDLYLRDLIYNVDILKTEFPKGNENSFIWYSFTPWYSQNENLFKEFDYEKFKAEKIHLWQKTDPNIKEFKGNNIELYIGSQTSADLKCLDFFDEKSLNVLLINLNQRMQQDSSFVFSDLEKALLKKYSLNIERIGKNFTIKTEKTNSLIFKEKINFNINYIDRIKKIDKRSDLEKYLNFYQLFLKNPKEIHLNKKITFQERMQQALNGMCQKRFWELSEALVQRKYAFLSADLFRKSAEEYSQTKTQEEKNLIKHNISWNEAWNRTKFNLANGMINKEFFTNNYKSYESTQKKFIVGLSQEMPGDTFRDFEDICATYGQYIKYWYVSPPFGKIYQSRSVDYDLKNLLEKIKILRKYDQKIQLALNTEVSPEELKAGFYSFKKFFGEVDSIVTLAQYIPLLKDENIPITYSFNNLKFDINLMKDCEAAVVGRRYLRDLKTIKKLKQEGIKIELLVNNGCHYYCNRECTLDCVRLQKKRIQEKGLMYCLAEQSLLPEELNFYPEELIDYIKISSRPSWLEYLRICLEDYINKSSSQNLLNINNWHYYCRLRPLLDSFKAEEINLREIMSIKKELWQKAYEF